VSALALHSTTRRNYIREVARSSHGRRSVGGVVAITLCGLALVIALIPIVSIVVLTVSKGVSAWSLQFFTSTPRPEGIPGGGILNAIVGALIIDGIAAAIALPVGFVAALFLAESEGRFAGAVRFVVDVAAGLPAVTIGLFAYAVVVLPSRHFSGLSASIALAVLMLPVTIRAGETAIRTVPRDLWEAGIALGIPRARVARSIVIPTAFPGLVTAALLAISRAVGEAAPLLFTAIGSQLFAVNIDRPMASLPLVVFLDGIQPYPDLQQTAWGAALTLLVIVVLLNVSARLLARRMRRYAQ